MERERHSHLVLLPRRASRAQPPPRPLPVPDDPLHIMGGAAGSKGVGGHGFSSHWNAQEEMRLLDAVEQFDYGNWKDAQRLCRTSTWSSSRMHGRPTYMQNLHMVLLSDVRTPNAFPRSPSRPLLAWDVRTPNAFPRSPSGPLSFPPTYGRPTSSQDPHLVLPFPADGVDNTKWKFRPNPRERTEEQPLSVHFSTGKPFFTGTRH